MISSLRHRGPDGRGSESDGSVHLGHTRLAVIDLATGDQPMSTADASLTIVYNGEIYDADLLRVKLERGGSVFRTRSDTEVILEAYRQHGVDCLDHLNGMFAFVIHDRVRRLLFGARDRFGKKPLYYTTEPAGNVSFAFASELTSLCQHSAVGRRARLHWPGVISYLLHDATIAPLSVRSGIAQLPAGEAFTFGLPESREPGFRRWKYWEIRLGQEESRPADDVRELLERLDDSVRRRLVADVPLGLFLSGGIDSSAMLALMARHRPAREIPTFSVGFDDASFDESRYADEVARQWGSDHHHRLFTAADLLARFDAVVDHLDEPIADPSILPTALLSEFTRERVTVALSGEGGDELFAGYDPFRAIGPATWCRRLIPSPLRPILAQTLPRLVPASEANMSLDFKVARFLRGLAVAEPIQLATWMGSFSVTQLPGLLEIAPESLSAERVLRDVMESDRAVREGKFDRAGGGGNIDRALDFFQRYYLPNDILRKVDRASMRVGLEVRCPLLDTHLGEFVNGLPADRKFAGGVTKRILREALRRGFDGVPLVSESILSRPKKGFGIPIARWLRNELAPRVRRDLIDDWPEELSLVRRAARTRLVEEHLSREANRAKEVWSLLVLARWVRTHAP